MRIFASLVIFAGCGLMTALAGDQTLFLRDGRSISGSLVSGNSQYVIFRDDSGVRRRFDLNQIQSLDFTGGYQGSSATGPGNYQNYPYSANRSASQDAGYTLPAGTQVSVRTDEDIDSNTATVGQTFSAVASQDVMGPNGEVLIPRGSPATLIIRQLSGGGVTSSPNLALDLQSVSVNGRNYLVSTEDITQSGRSGLGANRRTAEYVGGGAALGTLVGAIAGGGKGAAIGALAGAALGGTTQVLTKGKTVKVPAETELTFRLDQPVYLQPY